MLFLNLANAFKGFMKLKIKMALKSVPLVLSIVYCVRI